MATSFAAQRPGRSAPPRLTSYERERRAFSLAVPERFNPVVDIVERWAQREPDAEALLSLDAAGGVVDRHTNTQLAEESQRAARALHALGVRQGDRVFVMLPRCAAWYFAMLGTIRLGAVPMPAPNLLTPRDIAYRMGKGHAVAAITDAGAAVKVDEIRNQVPGLEHLMCWAGDGDAPSGWSDWDALRAQADDGPLPPSPTAADEPSVIFFTSGTESYPKMVAHPQSYALGHVGTARFWHDLRPGDLHWTVSDTGWAKAAWGGLFGQWHEGACVMQVALGRPDADTILSILARQGVTSFCAPPTLYRMLVLADLGSYDLSRLRHCTSAGEPLNPEVIRIWREGTGGLTVYDGYGQSETTVIVANFRSVPVRPGSMGHPVPGYEVEILDDDDRRAPDGEVGSVAVRYEPTRPVGLFSGYVDDEAANERVFRDGWYHTGDRASRDADGYLWFEGRGDDVITSAAYRIGPFEVESALIEHAAVAEAAVVGKDDPERTQIVCAFVVPTPGHEPSDELARELQEHTKALTAPYKYPREIRFVEELPKTVSGKIRRSELRHRLRVGEPG